MQRPGLWCIRGDSRDYDDKSGLVLGADFLGHVAPQVRLGGGVLFAPATSVEDEDGGEGDLGADLSLLGIVEGVFDVGPTTALAIRGFGGVALLLAGDDLEDENADVKEVCRETDVCEFDEGSNAAFTFGVVAG